MTIRYRSKETLSEIIISETSFFVIPKEVFIMAKIDVLSEYEDLLNFTAEIRESLNIIHNWLSREPRFDKPETYCDIIVAHGSHFALLNLIMHRLDSLEAEHRTIIENAMKGN